LLDAESLSRAIAGSTYVVHTASPFYFPANEDDVVKPAVEGTMAVLKACSASNVKRLVITSSCAAVVCMAAEDKPDLETGFYDESCWSNAKKVLEAMSRARLSLSAQPGTTKNLCLKTSASRLSL
jgi:nucleoside-diphosphate-sugar epimerase